MDVLRLNKDTYLPEDLIEGYSSMIWTERYTESGDFEMKTPNVAETMQLMPEEGLVSLLDTNEVMQVETHSIGQDDDGVAELTITGRSLDRFLEKRFIEGPYGRAFKMALSYTPAETAQVILWNSVINTTVNDVLRYTISTKDPLDAVPNTAVTDSVVGAGDSEFRWLEEGPVYPQLNKFLGLGNLGIRMLRPNDLGVWLIQVTTADPKGVISRNWHPSTVKMCWDVYDGVDRSIGAVDEPVVFLYKTGHIQKPEYLFSIKELGTLVKVKSSSGGVDVYRSPTTGPTLGGLDRRVVYIDAGSPDSTESGSEFLADLPQFGRDHLRTNSRRALFSGSISPLSPYKYKRDYDLGDLVTLKAEYDVDQTMQVVEFTRTEDVEGERNFPGLIEPSE